jgi:hypothetical protein
MALEHRYRVRRVVLIQTNNLFKELHFELSRTVPVVLIQTNNLFKDLLSRTVPVVLIQTNNLLKDLPRYSKGQYRYY